MRSHVRMEGRDGAPAGLDASRVDDGVLLGILLLPHWRRAEH